MSIGLSDPIQLYAAAQSVVGGQRKGSSRITGEGGFYLQEEEFAVAVAVGHPVDGLDLVVDAF